MDKVFCIDICAYAVMFNHTHLVLRLNTEQAESLDEESLVKRWTQLYKCPVLIQRYLKGECKTAAEQDKVKEILDEWRIRIMSISWYMSALNEYLARCAKMAQTPEESDYIAIQQRIRQWHKTKQAQDTLTTPAPTLMPLVKQHRDTQHRLYSQRLYRTRRLGRQSHT